MYYTSHPTGNEINNDHWYCASLLFLSYRFRTVTQRRQFDDREKTELGVVTGRLMCRGQRTMEFETCPKNTNKKRENG